MEAQRSSVILERPDGRDRWATPWREFGMICQQWGLTPSLDVAADASNHKCDFYLTAEQDALSVDWTEYCAYLGLPLIGWLNCPYSQPLMTRFIEKAIFEAEKGFSSIFLLPDSTDDVFFDLIQPFPHKFWRDPEKTQNRRQRIRFLPPPGIKATNPSFGNVHGVITYDEQLRESIRLRGQHRSRLQPSALAHQSLDICCRRQPPLCVPAEHLSHQCHCEE
jgi:phage N-6-adenine-methyltransferase